VRSTPQPLVTALVVTYNHEQFIRRALESIGRQVLDQPFEIVIADDSSTDRTVEIAKAWAEGFVGEFRVLSQEEERLGITRNYQRAFLQCSGEFIAVLEGDDEWLTSDKLRRLSAPMAADPTLAMAGNYTMMVDEANGTSTLLPDSEPRERRIDVVELSRGNAFSTFSACMYRTSALRAIRPETFDVLAYDWLINMSVMLSGDALLVPEVLTMYRRHAGGVWSSKSQRQRDEQVRDILPGYIALFDSPVSDSLTEMHRSLVAVLGPSARTRSLGLGWRARARRALSAR
jgi:glycosyltransferase involved in cell wall biosynthesis